MKKVTLAFCKGSNEGQAIYLNCMESEDSGTGFRIAGPKCWGYINTIKSFELDERDLNDLITEAKLAKKFLKKKT